VDRGTGSCAQVARSSGESHRSQTRLGQGLTFLIWTHTKGSSLGNYSPKFTTDFFKSARGHDPKNWVGTRAGTEHAPVKIIYRESSSPRSIWLARPHAICLDLPASLATVDATRYGRLGGGTFFCDEKKWTDKTKQMFYDAVSKRGPVLMHIKVGVTCA
jgi:hypothetical protein